MKPMSQTSPPRYTYSSKPERKHGKQPAKKRPHLSRIYSIGSILSSLRSKKLAKMAKNYEYESSSSTSSNGIRHINKSPKRKSCHSCALTVLLALVAAILGVITVLHKLGDKRVFSLLLDEKDHDFLTLQLHFQREQEFNKEVRKEIEGMRTNVYSLRSEKFELERRLVEMESTITSLRDERKVLESTLAEKKNEMNSTFAEVSTLKDVIRMKETEIEGLKLLLNTTSRSIIQTGKESVRVSDHTTAKKGEIGSKSGDETGAASSRRVSELADDAVNDSGYGTDDAGAIGVGIQVRRRHPGSKRIKDGRKRRLENSLYAEREEL